MYDRPIFVPCLGVLGLVQELVAESEDGREFFAYFYLKACYSEETPFSLSTCSFRCSFHKLYSADAISCYSIEW